VVHIYLFEGHFEPIISMPAFFGRVYHCETCNIGYSNKEDHRCNRNGCCGCQFADPCALEQWVHCKDCNRYLPSQSCYTNHKSSPRTASTAKLLMSLCDRLKRCTKCEQIIRTSHKGQHVCDLAFCRTCNCNVDRTVHQCYIQVLKCFIIKNF